MISLPQLNLTEVHQSIIVLFPVLRCTNPRISASSLSGQLQIKPEDVALNGDVLLPRTWQQTSNTYIMMPREKKYKVRGGDGAE